MSEQVIHLPEADELNTYNALPTVRGDRERGPEEQDLAVRGWEHRVQVSPGGISQHPAQQRNAAQGNTKTLLTNNSRSRCDVLNLLMISRLPLLL